MDVEKLMRLVARLGKCPVSLKYDIDAGQWEATADTDPPSRAAGSGPEVALEGLELAVKFQRIRSEVEYDG